MKMVIVVLVLTFLSACGTSHGWRVEFGIAPVNGLHNVSTLKDKAK